MFSVNEFGVITLDTADIRAEFEEAYKNALGSNLNTDVGTPQGQMIVNDTQNLVYAQNQVVLVANAMNVLTATGKALDVAAQRWGYYRKQATSTVVIATITGTNGTVIPEGSLVSNGDNQFALSETVTIPVGGSISAQFVCTESGAIPCASNMMNTIVTVITGWSTVNNPQAGVMGYEEENDALFRARITANWFNIRARSILGAIVDNLAQIDGVISVIGRENMGDTSITIDDVSLSPHSIYIDILGGSGSEIAKVLSEQKTLGAATNGSTQVSYYDTEVNVNNTYNIARPVMSDIKVEVTYSPSYYTPADVENQIKEVLIAYVQENPFMIGKTISGNDLAKAFNDFKYANIMSVKVAFLNDVSYSDYISCKISECAVLEKANISCVEV